MKRIYHDYRRWEDFKNGMWNNPDPKEKQELLEIAIKFTGNHIDYGKAMIDVVKKWKYSCEHNLTDKSTNRQAWIGHAACSLRLKLPESIVRQAWGMLTEDQRIAANKEADKAISMFFEKNNKQLSLW